MPSMRSYRHFFVAFRTNVEKGLMGTEYENGVAYQELLHANPAFHLHSHPE